MSDTPPLVDLFDEDAWDDALDGPPDETHLRKQACARQTLARLRERVPLLRGTDFLGWLGRFLMTELCDPKHLPSPAPRRQGSQEIYLTAVSDCFLKTTEGKLARCSRRRCLAWHAILKKGLAIMVEATFPPHLGWRHCAPFGDTVVSSMLVSSAMMELLLFPGSQSSQTMRRFLPAGEQRAFDPSRETPPRERRRRQPLPNDNGVPWAPTTTTLPVDPSCMLSRPQA